MKFIGQLSTTKKVISAFVTLISLAAGSVTIWDVLYDRSGELSLLPGDGVIGSPIEIVGHTWGADFVYTLDDSYFPTIQAPRGIVDLGRSISPTEITEAQSRVPLIFTTKVAYHHYYLIFTEDSSFCFVINRIENPTLVISPVDLSLR